MLCLAIFQSDIVPAPLAQLGIAVVVLYITFKIIQEVRQMLGKREDKQNHDSRTDYRLDKLDEEMKERITRTEYESRHSDMLRALQRMEAKLDGLIGIRKLFTGKDDPP